MDVTTDSGFIFRSGRVCCIPGCYNCEYSNIDYEYYTFPGRKNEVDRKRRWIDAVKEVMDNKSWMPNRNTRICSAHFSGGKQSTIENDEAYVPTIFPEISKRKKLPEFIPVTACTEFPDAEAEISALTDPFTEEDVTVKVQQDIMQYQNGHEQVLADDLPMFTIEEEIIINNDQLVETSIANMNENTLKSQQTVSDKKICTRTDNCTPDNEENLFKSKQISSFNKVDEIIKACTAGIEKGLSKYKAKSISKVTLKTKRIKGLLGLEGVADERALWELTGVSPDTFTTLLKLQEGIGNQERVVFNDGTSAQMLVIPEHKQFIKIENAMLLFLMKMKCGLSFSDLGRAFDISSETSMKVFLNLLNVLVGCTKSCIFWPMEINGNKDNHPSMTCFEIPVESPTHIKSRILMYSRSKGVTTVKFLIAITSDGVVCKISNVFGGRISDEYIATQDCLFSDFSEHKVIDGSISPKKIRVQKAIDRVKASRILNHISYDLVPFVDDIVHMCCIFANSQLSMTT